MRSECIQGTPLPGRGEPYRAAMVHLLFRCCAVVALATTLMAQDDYIIYIKQDDLPKDPPQTERPQVVAAVEPQRVRGDLYKPFVEDPEQTFIDSKAGPLPLYFEAVYDKDGHPQPRFPHYIAKQLYDDPTEEAAYVWLSVGEARYRRAKEVMMMVQRTAMKYGFVTPADLTKKREDMPHPEAASALPLGDAARPQDWGTPILSDEGMRRLGLDDRASPRIPGISTQFQVLYLWDHRVKTSVDQFKVFAQFGASLLNLDAAITVKSIDLAVDDPNGFMGQMRFFEGDPDPGAKSIKRFANFIDLTNLRGNLGINAVPTVIFVDKRLDKIHRIEGGISVERLQREMDGFLGVESTQHDGSWKPDRMLFLDDIRKRQLQAMRHDFGYDTMPSAPMDLEPVPEGAAPVIPGIPDLKPWDPSSRWYYLGQQHYKDLKP